MATINAADWQVISFTRTVANGFKLELGSGKGEHPDDESVVTWDETRGFEWESPQFTPIFEAADVGYRPDPQDLDAAPPTEALKALAQDAFAQMEREANPPAPPVPDGTSLADLLS